MQNALSAVAQAAAKKDIETTVKGKEDRIVWRI